MEFVLTLVVLLRILLWICIIFRADLIMEQNPKYRFKERSKLRLYFGKKYFIFRRYMKWYFGKNNFSKNKIDIYPETIFKHKSFLLRKLKDVDMQLQYNKITNLQQVIDRLDKIVIQPGETFSFWYLTGRTTKRKGYKKGMNLVNGKVTSEYGGGICQMGNLIYWMALHTPLTIKERWRHSFDVFPDVNRTLPFGSGATLSYNYIDLQLTNNTQQAFQLHLWLDDEYLNGEFRSDQPIKNKYEVYEAKHIIKHEIWGAYTRHNVINRKTIDKETDHVVSDDPVTKNHAVMMYEPMLKSGNQKAN